MCPRSATARAVFGWSLLLNQVFGSTGTAATTAPAITIETNAAMRGAFPLQRQYGFRDGTYCGPFATGNAAPARNVSSAISGRVLPQLYISPPITVGAIGRATQNRGDT